MNWGSDQSQVPNPKVDLALEGLEKDLGAWQMRAAAQVQVSSHTCREHVLCSFLLLQLQKDGGLCFLSQP